MSSYRSCQIPPELLLARVEDWARTFFGTPPPARYGSENPLEADCLSVSEACELMEIAPEYDGVLIILERLAELHERYAEWSAVYSDGELNGGLQRMFSLPCWLSWLPLDEALPFAPRARLLRSLAVPYRDYVLGNPEPQMENGLYMLWHKLLAHEAPSPEIGDVCLEVLQEILALPDRRCESGALHGLNHLVHPDRPEVVQLDIDRHAKGLDREALADLDKIRDGEAM